MKALVLTDRNHYVYEDVPDPRAGPGDVVVEVKAAGICGSDIHGMDGSTGRRRPPLIMGHEASGYCKLIGIGNGEVDLFVLYHLHQLCALQVVMAGPPQYRVLFL